MQLSDIAGSTVKHIVETFDVSGYSKRFQVQERSRPSTFSPKSSSFSLSEGKRRNGEEWSIFVLNSLLVGLVHFLLPIFLLITLTFSFVHPTSSICSGLILMTGFCHFFLSLISSFSLSNFSSSSSLRHKHHH